jgi:serine/threonine protein kinase
VIGTEVGRYRLVEQLGAGGIGVVYVAVQPDIGSRVAVKLLSERSAADPELLERFFTEARAVNLIHHENIVDIFDLGRLPDGRPYIIMELVDGQTLGRIVRASRVPLGSLARTIIDVLAALGAAHAIGIVHRDMKPDNVLVTARGRVKVLDFGIAKLAPDLARGNALTGTGQLLGTPAYMAPEQIAGAATVDGRADLYAVGVMLYEAVTGTLPFVGSTFAQMQAHLEEAPRPARELRHDLPPAFERVIAKALAKSPADRFATAEAMSVALAEASASAKMPVDYQKPLALVPIAASRSAPDPVTPPALSAVQSPPTTSSASASTPTLSDAMTPTLSADSHADDEPETDGPRLPPKASADAVAERARRGRLIGLVGIALVMAAIGAYVVGNRIGGSAGDAPVADARPADSWHVVITVVDAAAARDAARLACGDRLIPGEGNIDAHNWTSFGFANIHLDAIDPRDLYDPIRSQYPDVDLVEAQLYPVARDGQVDITVARKDDPPTYFRWANATECRLIQIREDTNPQWFAHSPCKQPRAGKPRCTTREVMAQVARQNHAADVGRLVYDAQGWQYYACDGGAAVRVPDSCGK